VGHFQGTLLEDQQPMKMAAAEAIFETEEGAGLSIFATGDFTRDPGATNRNLKIPKLLSFLSPTTIRTRPCAGSTMSRASTSGATDPASTCRSSP
jgi:cytochrome bd-type quinol oxidase subunit 1